MALASDRSFASPVTKARSVALGIESASSIRRWKGRPGPPASVQSAWSRSTAWYRSIFLTAPAGWSKRPQKRLGRVREAAQVFVQKTNDRYANPSGKSR